MGKSASVPFHNCQMFGEVQDFDASGTWQLSERTATVFG